MNYRLLNDAGLLWLGVLGTVHAAARGVNPKADALKARTKRFAIDILLFAKTLSCDEPDVLIRRQLARSATSVGANYRAACRARSRAEFAAKIGVVLEEADESLFWLEVIDEAALECARPAWKRLIQEAAELTAIFAASSITARQQTPI